MVDFAAARRAMVDSQIQTSAVFDRRILTAMGAVPRELFVPPHRRDLAYIDDHHWLADGRFLAAPAVFARLVQLADIGPTDRVLDVGVASGYSAAVLARLAGYVIGSEENATLADTARDVLTSLGVSNVEIISYAREMLSPAHFHVILLEGAVDRPPQSLLDRLAPGGRLVALLRTGATATATVFTHTPQGVITQSHFNATLPSLSQEAPEVEFVF